MGRIFVARTRDFETVRVKVVRAGKDEVAVFCEDGHFYAVKNACPHQGHPLSSGRISSGILVCPGHNWQFEIASGKCVKGDTEISLKRYDVVVEEGAVFLSTALHPS